MTWNELIGTVISNAQDIMDRNINQIRQEVQWLSVVYPLHCWVEGFPKPKIWEWKCRKWIKKDVHLFLCKLQVHALLTSLETSSFNLTKLYFEGQYDL